MTREELIERAREAVWYNNEGHLKSIADFALEIRDEAVRERDAEWREAIDRTRIRDDVFGVGHNDFTSGYQAALTDLKAKMVD
jgi:hypothetical protein